MKEEEENTHTHKEFELCLVFLSKMLFSFPGNFLEMK